MIRNKIYINIYKYIKQVIGGLFKNFSFTLNRNKNRRSQTVIYLSG